MAFHSKNILKLLSDLSAASDKIVDENASELALHRVSEWATLVKNKVNSIVESESSTEFAEISSLKFFLKGGSSNAKRLSQVLGVQKSRLHEKGRSSIKTRKSQRESIKTPLRKSNKKSKIETTINLEEDALQSMEKSTPTVNDEAELALSQNASNSTPMSLEKKEEATLPSSLPPALSHIKDASKKKTDPSRSSKRKSSSKLSAEIAKKPKVNNTTVSKERDKASQNAKSEKLMTAKSSTQLLTSKTKSSAGSASVLKENRTLRSRMIKAVENRENILALRKQKLEESKRTREQKMEKSLQQRLKLEKEKTEKLILVEKEKVTQQKAMKKTPRIKEVTTKDADAESKTFGAPFSYSEKDKVTSLAVKMQNANKMDVASAISKSKEKTPVVKSSRLEKVLNTTYEKPSTKGKKAKTKDTNIIASSSGNKAVTIQKIVNEKEQVSTPLAKKKRSESYVITPSQSSFVSYDISEIRSDSEDEERPSKSKPIPTWATGVRLRNALLQQHHHPIDSDELFGNIFDPPDLVTIMGVKKARYKKRTSSAEWNTSLV